MKAISLWQPWATLVALGEKQIETRSWGTRYRGMLAIHAAKKWTTEQFVLCQEKPFNNKLITAGFNTVNLKNELPFGAIVAVCRLTTCVQITPTNSLAVNERELGDYRPGRFMWRLVEIMQLLEPVPYRGAQGFFEVDDSLIQLDCENCNGRIGGCAVDGRCFLWFM